MWHNWGGGDGFVTQQDWTDPEIMYSTSQGGNMGRYDKRTNTRTALAKPNWRTVYIQYEDSILAARGDTTRPATREQLARIAALRAAQKRDSADLVLRWNWNTPYFISRHSPTVLYMGANRVFKSTKRGDEMFPISPDLTTRDTMAIRISTTITGGITPDVTGAETFSTIVSLNESPIRPGLLVAGTDDGNVWLTRNDGGNWENLTGRFPGVPTGSYVSRVELSYADSGTFYVAFDNHRRQDFKPYVYLTTDFGRTFRSIAANLPSDGTHFVHVVREDPRNPSLLYAGTEVGVWVSLDRGGSWQRFMTGFPTTPVHDLVIHPRDGELVAGTHGRSIWIVDVNALQQMRPAVAAAPAHFFAPRTAYQWNDPNINGGNPGHQLFTVASPSYGAELWYRLAQPVSGQVRFVVQNAAGDTLGTVNGPGRAGLHRVTWGFGGRPAPRAALSPAQVRDSIVQQRVALAVLDSAQKAGSVPEATANLLRRAFTAGATGMQQIAQALGFGGPGGGAAPVGTGDYVVTMVAGGQTQRQVLRVERTPTAGSGSGFPFGEVEDDETEPDVVRLLKAVARQLYLLD
jgi:hypothetical protein